MTPDPVPTVPDSAAPAAAAGPTPPRRRRLRITLSILLVGLLLGGASIGYDEWTARHAWSQASAALERRDLAAAAEYLDRCLTGRPYDTGAWFLAGRTARRLGRFDRAEACLRRCQELSGVTAATRLEWDLLRVQQGDLGDVHTRLRTTIPPEHPDAPLVLEALARGYLADGRLEDALLACGLWTVREPDNPWPWLWRGGIYERLANFEHARDDYQHALELAPDDRDARLALGALLNRGRRPGPAAEHFERILRQAPDDAEALVGLAGCRIEQGRPDEALPLLERVPKGNPAEPRTLVLRGRAALERGDAAGAERWLSRATEQTPDDPEALHQLTLALRAQSKHAAADRLAPRLEALRRDVDRLDRLIRTVAVEPLNAALRHEAGVIALRLGRRDEGITWLLGALRVRGDHRSTHAVLAEHFARRNDPRAALHRRLAQSP